MAGRSKKPATKPNRSTSGSTIFVIRDDEHERNELSKLLTKARFKVHSYFTAREFILDRIPKTTGVVVADFRLRDSMGAELIEHLKAARISLPVILFVGPADIPKAAKLEVADILVHPFEIELLLRSIDRAMNGHEYDEDELHETFKRLTARELEVLDAVCSGSSSRDLGKVLGISTKTVEAHRARIKAKTRVRDIGELIRFYRAWQG